MVNETTRSYQPDYAVHPGKYLEEVLKARGIKKRELAEQLNISVKQVGQIIKKQAPITAENALQLEKILGISANIWNNLNSDHILFMDRQKEQHEGLN